jgi:hypothetical protein
MTHAVCLKCGEGKLGAFSPCMKCGYMPRTSSEQARAMLLCDHNLDRAALDAASARIKAGTPPKFDEAAIAEMAKEFEEYARHPPPGARGCRIFSLSLVAIAVLLFLLLVGLIIYGKSLKV